MGKSFYLVALPSQPYMGRWDNVLWLEKGFTKKGK